MRYIPLCAALALLPGFAVAQGTMTHTPGMTHGATALPSEAGQGGFGALAEIVAMLRADPQTDWTRVDIAALVAHLRDMDALMTEASAEVSDIPGGAVFRIGRDTPGADAAWRMVPAHGPVLAAETGWHSSVEDQGDSLVWTVTGAEAEIRALGFLGLMAVGNHHPAHHMALALGIDPHSSH